jgi:hypothetical protein
MVNHQYNVVPILYRYAAVQSERSPSVAAICRPILPDKPLYRVIFPILNMAYLKGRFVDEDILEYEPDLNPPLRLHLKIEPTLLGLTIDVVDRLQNVLDNSCAT